MTPRVAALDIETTALDTDVPASFDDLSTWTITAIGVGFRPSPTETPETNVLLRRGESDHAERRLLARLVNFVRDHEPCDALVSFNGDGFDFPVLAERADALLKSDRPHEQSLSFALHDALNVPHRDLMQEIIDGQPTERQWPSLEQSLTNRDIAFDVPTLDGERITGADMPRLGRRLMRGKLSNREGREVRRYIESDIRPLFELADALDEEREERIAAEAHATKQGQSATNTQTEADR